MREDPRCDGDSSERYDALGQRGQRLQARIARRASWPDRREASAAPGFALRDSTRSAEQP